MRVRDIQEYIETHYEEYPNFDGRTVADLWQELPEQDGRYADGDAGLRDMLNEIEYR